MALTGAYGGAARLPAAIRGAVMLAWLAACSTPDPPVAVEVPEVVTPVTAPADDAPEVAPVEEVLPDAVPEPPAAVAPPASPPPAPAVSAAVAADPAPAPAPAPAVAAAPAPAPAPAPEPARPPAPGPHGAVTYALDPDRSVLFVLVKYDRSSALGGQLGHDHAITATEWTGSVTWDPDDVGGCRVDVRVPVAGLVVDPPGMRALAGLEGETPESDKPKITANLRGPRQLDVERYPEIRFRSTSCSLDSGHVEVSGELTLHGVTKAVKIPMSITADEGSFHAVGALRARHTDFGFEPFTNALGAIKNANGLAWTIDVRGAAQ